MSGPRGRGTARAADPAAHPAGSRPQPRQARQPRDPSDARDAVPRLRLSIAALASLVGLVLVGVLSFGLLGGGFPDLGLAGGNGSAGGGGDNPNRTPDPVKPYVPAKKTEIKGTILFVKAGNVWSVSGESVLTQISKTGRDSGPVWSPDGTTVYFIETKTKKAMVPWEGHSSPYTLEYQVISRMAADGTGRKAIQDGLYKYGGGRYEFFVWLLQAAVSPNGKTFALISDDSNPSMSAVVQTLPVKGGKLTKLPLAEDYRLGHNDPAWSPSGASIAYTYNHREGSAGRPRIAIYDVKTKKTRFLTGFGYAQPNWSPNGKYVAAVRTSGRGRDVVVLDAKKGTELLRVTDDGRSFAPVWSPAGNQIVFLRAQGQSIDLVLASLGSGKALSVDKEEALTSQSQLDGTSRPAWFIPPDQLPRPTPSPTTAIPPGSSRAESPGAATPEPRETEPKTEAP
jgi:Tol biopolymer transport system component